MEGSKYLLKYRKALFEVYSVYTTAGGDGDGSSCLVLHTISILKILYLMENFYTKLLRSSSVSFHSVPFCSGYRNCGRMVFR